MTRKSGLGAKQRNSKRRIEPTPANVLLSTTKPSAGETQITIPVKQMFAPLTFAVTALGPSAYFNFRT